MLRPLLALAALSALLSAGPAVASCAAPSVAAAVRGDQLVVTGDAWVIGCNDSCSCSVGCRGERCDCGPPPVPVEQVVVQLRSPDGRVLDREVVPAQQGAFSVTLRHVPGASEVVATGGGATAASRLPADR